MTRVATIGLYFLVFAGAFYVFNLMPVIKVTYSDQFILLGYSRSRWCSWNYWYCYNDYSDGTFPEVLKSELISLVVLPALLPTGAVLLVSRIVRSRTFRAGRHNV